MKDDRKNLRLQLQLVTEDPVVSNNIFQKMSLAELLEITKVVIDMGKTLKPSVMADPESEDLDPLLSKSIH